MGTKFGSGSTFRLVSFGTSSWAKFAALQADCSTMSHFPRKCCAMPTWWYVWRCERLNLWLRKCELPTLCGEDLGQSSNPSYLGKWIANGGGLIGRFSSVAGCNSAKARCSTDQRSMATEMLWVSLEERSRTNSPRQRFHSQLFCKIVRYCCGTLYNRYLWKETMKKLKPLRARNKASPTKVLEVLSHDKLPFYR